LNRNEHPLIETRIIDGPADAAERGKTPLTTLLLVEEMPHGAFKEFIGTLVVAASELPLDLSPQIR